MTRPAIVCIGECMLELRPASDDTFALGFAGDTYNTAVYARRVAAELGLDLDVAYLTGVGDDRFSARMRRAWAAEGVRDLAIEVAGAKPGIYAIENGADGERRFTYWRAESAARTALRRQGWMRHLNADVVYLSGITLQLLTPAGRARLLDHLQHLRRSTGCLVAFDTNYRSVGWRSPVVAVRALDAFSRGADLVFATLDDELALRGPMTREDAARKLAAKGPREVVVKDGANGVLLWSDGQITRLAAAPASSVVDTTAAGDAFAGAYLASRLAGNDSLTSASIGTQVASVVVGHPGALTPRHASLTAEICAGVGGGPRQPHR